MKRLYLAGAVLLLAGCQTQQSVAPPEPVAPPPPISHPAHPVHPPVESAGPLTRAGVETYMDAQEDDLRSYLRGQGVLVARRGNTLAVTVASDRLFDKSGVGGWGNAFLQSVAQVLAHYDHTQIEVNGYSNSSGNEAHDLDLSRSRAKAVAEGLSRNGVASSRMTANGLGATNLRIAKAGDPRNRRIEIKITPKPQGE